MDQLELLSKKLIENKYTIAREITNIKPYQELDLDESVIQELLEGRAQFIYLLAQSLQQDKPDSLMKDIAHWAEFAGQAAIASNAPMKSTLSTSKLYRKHIWKYIREIATEYDLSLETVFDAASIIDPLLDEAILIFGLSYVQYHENALKNTKEEFLSISSPVVKIFDSVAILPLIGDIDGERAHIILEKTLNKASQYRLSHLIIDLSGVTMMDDMVASEIMKIAEALKLLGIKVILTGILPDMAHKIIQQGIHLPDIETLGSLEKAVRELLMIQ
ncbi:STAS domain-containing protein [Rossellomorea vietnamensis]|uniref:STAS domain-containing protein n=1 Tax=Rossellomorea vietnamensis TaxID=218284 RepID=A0A5D4MG51_9BACI|nr:MULTISPECIES: STAS domain-containing protein [Bacillaceae]TYS00324.1 STAS domain-containing protein [Rossellomorea vietnamensis]